MGLPAQTCASVLVVLLMQGIRPHTLKPRLRPQLSPVFRQMGDHHDRVGTAIATTGFGRSDLACVRSVAGCLDLGDFSEFPRAPRRTAPTAADELERWRRGLVFEPGSTIELISVEPRSGPLLRLPWRDRPMDAMVYRAYRVEESHRGR